MPDDSNPLVLVGSSTASAEFKAETDDMDIISQALERWKMCEDAEAESRRMMLEDMKFCDLEEAQWDSAVRAERNLQKRPCLVVNTTQQFVKQVVNNMRQNMPSIHVAPVEDSDEETAEVFEGMTRHIERRSNAGAANGAYDTAATLQVKGGLGFIRVVTAYENNEGFNQEILIKRVKGLSCYLDPFGNEPDGSDAMFGFAFEDMRKKDFEKQYPDADSGSNGRFSSPGRSAAGWVTANSVRVAEYFVVKETEKTVHQLGDGQIIDDDTLQEYRDMGGMDEPLASRTLTERKITWYKMTANEILETKEWPGKYIPIVPVPGEEIEVDGKMYNLGLVRRLKDPARMSNYWKSAQAEMIALAPKAPFIAAAGQIAGFENIWNNANTANYSVLPYNPIDIQGTALSPPQRQQAEAPVQTIIQAGAQADEDQKRVTGLYNTNLGASGAERSGRAILAQQSQGDNANFHFMDNLGRSIQQIGRIIVDLIPKVYDTPRIVRILNLDGTTKPVGINQPVDPETGMPVVSPGMEAVTRVYDTTVGTYDVTVETGPSYNTKRQQAADSMSQIAAANPALWQVAGDLLVKNFDWPGADELADRLKQALPPQLKPKEEGEAQVSPEMQAQFQQMQGMIQQLTQALNEAKDKEQTKELELASKERIAVMQSETQVAIADLKANFGVMQEELAHLRATREALAAPGVVDKPLDNAREQQNTGINAAVAQSSAGGQ